MAFFQTPPRLGNQYDDDALLREILQRLLPPDELRALEPELRHVGDDAGGRLFAMQQEDRLREPVLTQWDPWGNRIDHVEVTPLWHEAQKIAAVHGLVATPYEKKQGDRSRVVWAALNYLLDASLDVYSCPLAMTDGAAKTLLVSGNQALVARALPRLTSRDPEAMWTSGQWMTERTGGSDVGLTETVAKKDADGTWRLWGTKWFTSAVTSNMALTLARPDGNEAGGRGLALFYVELRDAAGRLDHISVNRLKDKLGTRKVPTAELDLAGTHAIPVMGLGNGVRNITPMLNVTRTWNAVGASAGMRRAVALARDYAGRRFQFGANLSDKPLHVDTLAGIAAEAEAGFLLTIRAAHLLGKEEAGVIGDGERHLARLVTPLVKLTTGKQAVAVASEALEAFGGAGYIEDTGLPRLLRDAQVLPIWEGTTNVLSLDVLRVLGKEGDAALAAYGDEIERALAAGKDAGLRPAVETVRRAVAHAHEWLAAAMQDPARLEAGARRFALTLGRALALALAVEHAGWCLEHGKGRRSLAAARRFARNGVDQIAVELDENERELALG